MSDPVFDTVIPISNNHIGIATKAIESIHKYTGTRKIFLITSRNNFKFLKKALSRELSYTLVDEKSLFKEDVFAILQRILDDKWGSSARAGWYYQQFIKMQVSFYHELADHYLIWDADTVLLAPIKFFSEDGQKTVLNKKTEFHVPYFKTLLKVLNSERKVSFSFISEHMMIDKKYMQELVNEIELNSGKQHRAWVWPQYIMENINERDINKHPGFSEFETYGNYIANKYPNSFKVRSLKSSRYGALLFGEIPNRFDRHYLKENGYVFCSFEGWHAKLNLIMQVKIALRKLASLIFFLSGVDFIPHTTFDAEREDKHLKKGKLGMYKWIKEELPSLIVVKLYGGFANQLWQYMAGLALYSRYAACEAPQKLCTDISTRTTAYWQTKYKDQPKLYVDISYFKDNPEGRPFLLKEVFPDVLINENASVSEDYRTYREKLFSFEEHFLSLPPAIILDGYFQHYRYFELAKPHFKLMLKPLSEEIQALKGKKELVALHIRRGDYTKDGRENIHGLVPISYYINSLENIKDKVESPHILIFSDDIAFCKKNLLPLCERLGLPVSFPNGNTIEDFSTMARCKHFIIANSSYSAMAAFLGEQKDSIVYTPKMWHLSHNAKAKDILPQHWKTPAYSFYDEEKPKKPKVSIIIPVYNVEKWLDRCLESVCLQTEKCIEIIIVNDASPDNSKEIIDAYAEKDNRIVSIEHKENLHLGGARNTGIEASKGEWLLFVDSDDYIALDTVERFLESARRHPKEDLFVCGVKRVIGDRLVNFGRMPKKEIVIDDVFREHCLPRLKHIFSYDPSDLTTAWGKLWRRELFFKTGVRFPEHMSMEDFATTPRLLSSKQLKAVIIPSNLFFYQWRKESIILNINENMINDLSKAIGILKDFSKEQLTTKEQKWLDKRVFNDFFRKLHSLSPYHEDLIPLLLASCPVQAKRLSWHTFYQGVLSKDTYRNIFMIIKKKILATERGRKIQVLKQEGRLKGVLKKKYPIAYSIFRIVKNTFSRV